LIVGASVPFEPGQLTAEVPADELKRGGNSQLLNALRLGLNNHGADLMRGRSGFLSAVHTDADIAATVEAFAATLDDMQAEHLLVASVKRKT
jgi:glutamate-1-semialdehyde 2,1-aminomutase